MHVTSPAILAAASRAATLLRAGLPLIATVLRAVGVYAAACGVWFVVFRCRLRTYVDVLCWIDEKQPALRNTGAPGIPFPTSPRTRNVSGAYRRRRELTRPQTA